jgi:anti-sigma regulatory factor (Ser/Thr protein kinase)
VSIAGLTRQTWPTNVEEGNVLGPISSSPQDRRLRPSAAVVPTASPAPAPTGVRARPGVGPGEAIDLERQRLARDLHDVVGQALTAVRLAIVAIGRDGLPDGARAPLDVCLHQIDEALRAVRAFVRELRPPALTDLGLETAARTGLARHAALAGFRARIRVAGLAEALPEALETACYRVLEEALTNVDRHAAARSVEVVLRRRSRWLELVVADDGRGFDVVAASLAGASGTSSGLWGMRARVMALGGELAIRSAPGAGTRIRARFPLPDTSVEVVPAAVARRDQRRRSRNRGRPATMVQPATRGGQPAMPPSVGTDEGEPLVAFAGR